MRVDEMAGLRVLPHWLAQPYFRPGKPVLGAQTAKGGDRLVSSDTNGVTKETGSTREDELEGDGGIGKNVQTKIGMEEVQVAL